MKRLSHLPAFIVFSFLSVLLSCTQANGQTCSSFPLTGGVNLWPNGIIPVVFAPSFPESSKATVREAMKDWTRSGAAIRFVESYAGGPYVRVDPVSSDNDSGTGPHSPTVMHINTNLTVNQRSHVVHELGHAIGFPHEQSRPDRDSYVHVQTNNITTKGFTANFEVTPWECWPPGVILTPYDYGSIMHYDWCLSTVAGCSGGTKGVTDSMFAVDTSVQYSTMGDWVGNDGASMSELDKARIRLVYGKAIWVDVNSPCEAFETGVFDCGFLGFEGPFKSIAGAVGAAEANPSPSGPITKLMIKTGTYPHNEGQTLRIDKPMKLVAWQNAVRIE